MYLGCSQIPGLAPHERQPIDVSRIDVFLFLFFSLPLSLTAMKKMSSGEDQKKKNYGKENLARESRSRGKKLVP